ncbi:hypothetical protein C1T14_26460, partial [Escherichia coli]
VRRGAAGLRLDHCRNRLPGATVGVEQGHAWRAEGLHHRDDEGAAIDGAGQRRAGKIPHPLAMAITNTMFGPACSPIRGASAPGAGVSCGF